jgi:glycine/D-amino acid oxidase-like deaminating enzyme
MSLSQTAPEPHALLRNDLYSPDFVQRPYWHAGVDLSVTAPAAAMPKSADVVIIGGGYTGLSAAAVTAAAGRSTVILEAKTLGSGCSGLNGGQVSTSLKPSLGSLDKRFGDQRAIAIHREGIQALERLRSLGSERGLDCDWQPVGRFLGAHSPKHFESLRTRSALQRERLGIPSQIVSPGDQRREIGTDFYHGGIVYPLHAAIHPAKLSRELYRLAREAGAGYFERHAALSVKRSERGFEVLTPLGSIAARNVIIATNGYTGPFSPWHRRRVIPIASQIVATEALPPGLMDELLPTRRVISDSRRVVVYYRGSPDGTRILFGGRSTLSDTPPTRYAPLLTRWLRQIFPQLGHTRISYAWSGTVAYTFDEMPHLGQFDGVHYCMGYCGSGISLSTYFGWKIGLQVLGRAEGSTALDGVPFQTRPLYTGYPWFLASSILAYRLLDAFKL